MAKHSFEFKKKVVLEYLNGCGGTLYLSKKYNLGSNTQLRRWIKAYQTLGDEGLLRSRQKRKYSFEYKLHMVELYLSSEVSYQELASQEGMIHSALLAKWVNDFRIAGPDALRPKKKGQKKSLNSKDNAKRTTLNEAASVDISAEHVKQLEDELLKLRIENAFLKELRRLRLEDEAKMKDLQESSAVSEDSLN